MVTRWRIFATLAAFVGMVWTVFLAESIREAVTTDPDDPMTVSLIGADRVFAYALLPAWVVCAGAFAFVVVRVREARSR